MAEPLIVRKLAQSGEYEITFCVSLHARCCVLSTTDIEPHDFRQPGRCENIELADLPLIPD